MTRWRRLDRRVRVSTPPRPRMGGRFSSWLFAVGDLGSRSLPAGQGFLPFTTWIAAIFIPTTGKRSVIFTYLTTISTLSFKNLQLMKVMALRERAKVRQYNIVNNNNKFYKKYATSAIGWVGMQNIMHAIPYRIHSNQLWKCLKCGNCIK